MSSGSKAGVIAVVVIVLGLGGYEAVKGKGPKGDGTTTGAATTAPATTATTTTADAPATTATPATAAPAADATATATTAPAAQATTTTAPAAAASATTAPSATVPAADATATPPPAATTPAADATATTAPATTAPAADATATTTPAATAPAADASAATPTAPAATPDVPSFGVRIQTDGSAVVDGHAAPGAKISIQLDGAEIATATAGETGDFAALFDLPPAGAGRLLTMVATMSDGTKVDAGTSIAVAATAAPVVTAQTGTADATAKTDTPAATTSDASATAPTAAAAQTGTTAVAVTDQGAKVLQTGTDQPADLAANVTLDVISYPTPDTVQFGGKGKAGAFVRLYLDNAPLGDAVMVAADGSWTETQTGVAPKIYTLRVDELDATGKVTSRYETPFKRETPEALAAATASTTPAATTADATTAAASTTAADATSTASASTAPASTAAPSSSDAAKPATTAADSTAPAAPPAPVTVTVQPGFTLWFIAKSHLGKGVLYVQVYNANKDKIKNPDLIYPGQIFTVPQN